MEANQSYTVQTRLNRSTGINIIQLPQLPNFELPTGATKVSEVLEIVNFRARVSISSLAPSPLPNYLLEDSETDRLMKTLSLEWNSPRKQLNLLLVDGMGDTLLGSISLLNTSGYPFKIYDLKQVYSKADNVFIGNNAKLAFQLQDVGHGLLAGDDTVDIWCDFVRTISYFVPQNIIVNVAPAQNTVVPNITIQNLLQGGIASPNPSPIPNPVTPINEDDEMPFKVISQNYQAVDKDRLFVSCGYEIDYVIIALPSNPVEGTQVEIQTEESTLCFIDLNGKSFKNNSTYVALSIEPMNGVYSPGLLIYGKRKGSNQLTWLASSGYSTDPNGMTQSEYNERRLNPF